MLERFCNPINYRGAVESDIIILRSMKRRTGRKSFFFILHFNGFKQRVESCILLLLIVNSVDISVDVISLALLELTEHSMLKWSEPVLDQHSNGNVYLRTEFPENLTVVVV